MPARKNGAAVSQQTSTTSDTVTTTWVTRSSARLSSAKAEVTSTNVNTTTTVVSKRKRAINDEGKGRSYAPPEKYAHLKGVPDAIDYNLVLLLIGLNPGITTAKVGHAYSNRTNRFWRYLHSGGLTPDRMLASIEDQTLPVKYSLGTTNLVGRPTNDQAELSKKEMDDAVPELEEKIRKWKPEAICVVGKGIWDSIYRARHGQKVGKEFKYGWQGDETLGRITGRDGTDAQQEEWVGARVFVAPSTSGLVTIDQTVMSGIWKELGDWVNERRKERGIIVPSAAST
ncbi:uracil-DNA glycosylase-like protein [Kalaharituber pfeilii]|nr:uracil-DNA glycosylase-like protein [Kalaharituber pfeilii]